LTESNISQHSKAQTVTHTAYYRLPFQVRDVTRSASKLDWSTGKAEETWYTKQDIIVSSNPAHYISI